MTSYSNLDHAKPEYIQNTLLEERSMSKRFKKLVFFQQIDMMKVKKASPIQFRGPSRFQSLNNGLIAKDNIQQILQLQQNQKILNTIRSPDEMYMSLKKQQYSLIPQNKVQNDVSLRHPQFKRQALAASLGLRQELQISTKRIEVCQSLSIVQFQLRPSLQNINRK
uniref:Uncharacterized protein n=1 Tax=Spironucleus salmonicida TaxID=348837 RepID=V6LMK7_9EUKA|eukprot:EST44941.1 Hypothetical protein SS50377_14958 [Spironucleus salmonicida]